MRFHIVKRDAFPLWKRLSFYLGAVVIALLLGAVVLKIGRASCRERV